MHDVQRTLAIVAGCNSAKLICREAKLHADFLYFTAESASVSRGTAIATSLAATSPPGE